MHPLGSELIQTFCKLLEEEGGPDLEITRLLTRINYQVAYNFESRGKTLGGQKADACFVTRFTREGFPVQKDGSSRRFELDLCSNAASRWTQQITEELHQLNREYVEKTDSCELFYSISQSVSQETDNESSDVKSRVCSAVCERLGKLHNVAWLLFLVLHLCVMCFCYCYLIMYVIYSLFTLLFKRLRLLKFVMLLNEFSHDDQGYIYLIKYAIHLNSCFL